MTDPEQSRGGTTPAKSRSWIAGALLVFVCAFALQGVMQTLPGLVTTEDGSGEWGLRSPELPHGDTPYHIRIAYLYRTGEIARAGSDFHWMRASHWSGRFVDKELLYHIYLTPFTLGASDINDTAALTIGAKVANCFTFALLALCLFGALRAMGVRRPWLFSAMLIVLGGISFCTRSEESRAWPFYVMCTLAAWVAMARNQRLALLLVAAAFTLFYAAGHFLLVIWGIRALISLIAGPQEGTTRLAELRSLALQGAAIVGGFALGIVMHPGRADFLYTWLITYVHVFLGILKGPLHDFAQSVVSGIGLTSSYSAEDAERLTLGIEFQPFAGSNLLIAAGPAFACLFGLSFTSMLWRHRPSRESVMALGLGLLSVAMYINSMRFAEVMGPFMALFCGIWVEDFLRARHIARGLSRRAGLARKFAFAAAALVLISAAAMWSWALAGKDNRKPSPLHATALWLRDNPRTHGKMVYHAHFDAFPALFFYAPQVDYTVGMDPHYMLAHSRDQSNLTCDILDNNVDAQTVERIVALFDCDYILVIPAMSPGLFQACQEAEKAGRLKLAFVDHKTDMGLFEVVRK